MEKVKELRERLEKDLEKLEKEEGQTRDEEMTDEDLDNVAGGRSLNDMWKCPECGRIICYSRSMDSNIKDHIRHHEALRELYGDAYDRIFHYNK